MKKCLCVSLGYEGGCVLYANSLIKYFPNDVDVWISSSTDLPCERFSKKIFVKKGFKGQLISSFLFLPFYILIIISRILTGRYDKIIVFGPHNWDFIFLCVFKIFRKKAFVVIHDGVMHLGEKSFIHQILMTCSMKAATNIIFLSDNVKNRVREELRINKPSIIIPHGVINYNISDRIIAKQLSSKPNLLMIGRINYYKGISLIIDLIDDLDFDNIGFLIIAGSFDKKIDISRLKNNRKVKLVDEYLSEESFDSYVRSCDFLLMPYLEATQSGIAAVSIGYAKPAIASRVGAMQEQFHETSAYFMSELSSKELLRVINLAVSNRDLYLRKQKSLLNQALSLDWMVLSNNLCNYVEKSNFL